MSYLALYRRYRPTTFDKLIGQEHIVTTLVNQIENQRLGHAYLFTGTRGTGKTSCAKIFSKAINCESPVNGSPCHKCATCLSLQDPSNIDVIEIDAASNNGVNEIRELKENVQYPPVSCKYKVYIIDEVHMLTGAAFNALLKTLEEPPKHAVFILATTEVHKIPATILSRCMRFDFRLISIERITGLIEQIFKEQKKEYDKEAIVAIAKAGEGSIRDALSIADIAISYSDKKLTYNDVMNILGSTNFETILELTNAILDSKTGELLGLIDKVCESGKSVGVIIKEINSLLRDALIIKTCEDANKILSYPTDKYNALKSACEKAVSDKILRALEIFTLAENSLKYSNNPRIVFETSALKASKPQSDYDIDALMVRIKTLEEIIEKGDIKVCEAKKEPKREVERKEETIEKKDVESATSQELKAKVLTFLRKNGSEMLWNVMQSVSIETIGKVVKLTPSNSSDGELIKKVDNVNKIKEALNEYLPFEIEVEEYKREKLLSEVDDATEKIKKIFGDDIVIVKK